MSKKVFSAPLFLLLMQLPLPALAATARYAVAVEATPVLNRADFPAALSTRDSCGQIRAVEFVALPGTVFTLDGEQKNGDLTVYRVTSGDYPYPTKTGYYVDSRYLRLATDKPAERAPTLPPRDTIIFRMKQRLGSGYVWGGNVAGGVTNGWGESTTPLLAGVDCSGLLYEATGGYTPRNTSALVQYGRGVQIGGKDAASLTRELRPLDLIVWPGHVLIVIDEGDVIESRLVCGTPSAGVRIRPLRQALTEIMKTRRPVDSIAQRGTEFVVRRWYGEQH